MPQDTLNQTVPPQGANEPQVNPYEAPAMPPLQQSQAFIDEQIRQAKELLGVNELEQKLSLSEEERIYKDNMLDVLSKHPELTKEKVEEELSKLAEQNPELAKDFKTSKDGLDIFIKGIKATINPNKKADDITDDSSTSAQQDDEDPILEKIKKGEAKKDELGAYLNSLEGANVTT